MWPGAQLTDPPEIPPLTHFDMYAWLGLVRVMEPETEVLMRERAERERIGHDHGPHERPWFVSFHGSEFPGDPMDACKRYLLYRMMDLPPSEIVPPWVTTTGKIGKAGELDLADAWWQGGRLLAVPEDQGDYHQLGFVNNSLWFTVSTDLPILQRGWTRPHIVEVKCLAGDTLVLTECGKLPIRQIAQGSSGLELVNGRGEWQWCPVKSFGEQETYEIKLKRGNEEKVIRATGDHRWFVDKTPQGEKHTVATEIITTQLATGDKLTYRAPYSKIKKGGDTRPSPFGIARGVVYGDGTIKTSGGGSMVDLFGEKDAQLLRYFEGCKVCDLANEGKRVVDLPRYFKTERPSLYEGVSYLYGWLAGYFAADGTVSKNGSCFLDCADREPLEYVETLCTLLGIPTRTIYEFETGDRTTPQGNEYSSRIAYRICIQAHGLTEGFFLIEEHRRRWLGRGKESPAKRKDRWEVVDVTHGGIEEVFCAIVEGTQQFVLDGFILTGNCKADEVLEEMLQGRVLQQPDGTQQLVGRGPDKGHVNQLKATIGEAHDYDWGWVTVCPDCWFILWSEIYERLGLPGGRHPLSDAYGRCPRCEDYKVGHNFRLEPPTSGEIYYWSRSWPRKTKSFYYEYDSNFMVSGRRFLAEAREHFLADELPPRPDHFQWSVGACKDCVFKSTVCRHDAGVPGRKRKPDPKLVRTTLSGSNGVEYAQALRPWYRFEEIRERVFAEWEPSS